MRMRRILMVGQDKGGLGKSLAMRALAESVVAARIVELGDEKRLAELEDRVDFFPVRTERSEIDCTSGAAARSEYTAVIDLMARKPAAGAITAEPLIVDIGANASRSFLPEVASRAARYGRIGVEFAMLTVITAEPGAASSAPVVLDLARPFAKPLFTVENQIEGPVDAKILKALGKNVVLRRLARLTLNPKANSLLQRSGLRFIAERLGEAEDNLSETYGFAAAGRMIEDLTAFRAQAMQAVTPRAEWLEGRPDGAAPKPPTSEECRAQASAEAAGRQADRVAAEESRRRADRLLPGEAGARLDALANPGDELTPIDRRRLLSSLIGYEPRSHLISGGTASRWALVARASLIRSVP